MKNQHYIFALLLGFLFLVACEKKQDTVFSNSASERIAEAELSLKKQLVDSEYGWILQYYPRKGYAYGGYNFAVSFSDDMTVTAQYECADLFMPRISNPSTELKISSRYNITQSAGVTIEFNSFNDFLHYFANPSQSEFKAKGGDFIFTVFESSNPDIIPLKGQMSTNHMMLIKLKEPAEDYLNKVNKLGQIEAKSIGFKLDYLNDNLVHTSSTGKRTFELFKDGEKIACPYIFTDNSIKFVSPLSFSGNEYSELLYNDLNQNFVSTDGNLTASFIESPINFLLDWTLNFENNKASTAILNEFQKGEAEFKNGEFGPAFQVLPMFFFLGKSEQKEAVWAIRRKADGIPFMIDHGIKWGLVPNLPNQLTFEATTPGGLWQTLPHFSPLLNYIAKQSPFICEKEDEKKIKLTSSKNPEAWFYIERN